MKITQLSSKKSHSPDSPLYKKVFFGEPGRSGKQVFKKSYTYFVKFLKIALPLLALGLLSLLAIWPSLHEEKSVTSPTGAALLQMLKPRYVGVDQKDKPFTLYADWAKRSSEDDNIIELSVPHAEITMENNHWITISAKNGYYDQKLKRLKLVNSVVIYNDEGYEIKTEEAFMDDQAGNAWGEKMVYVQGPFGTVISKGFKLLNRGTTLFMNGPAKATLVNLDKKETS